MTTLNPAVDAFVARAKRWPDEIQALRPLLVGCGLGEELKWGKPCYTSGSGNIAIIQPFKDSCALMFFRGTLLKDTHDVLKQVGPNSQAGLRMEFTSVAEITKTAPILRAYVKQAVALEKAGIKVDFKEKHELVLPEELTAKMKANKALATAFRALTPGRQRAYVLFFTGAKQSTTRLARIDKSTDKILAGKGPNDR